MSKQVRKRRRSSAIVAAILAVALVLTGTLAWQAISQKALNNVGGEITPAGARLHDDFALEDNPDFIQPMNKDVYVENYSGQNPTNQSDAGEPVYVRVKLTEYMEMGAGAGLFTLSGDDPSDYQTLDQVDANGTRIEDSNNEADSLVPGGSILDLKTWRTHIEGEASNPFAPYWSWTMGGSKAFMPTFNKDNTSLLTDRTDYAQDKFIVGNTQMAAASYASDLYDAQSETHTAKNTLTTAGVLSMVEWKALGSPMDKDGLGYWVGDSDGWYYWSKGLAAGEATALLIDTISLTGTLEGEFYYGIHVASQMATGGDWGDKDADTGFYDDGLTDDGLFLLNQAAGLIDTYSIVIEQVTTGNANNTVMQGKTIDYKAKVMKTNRAQGERQAENQNVTWELVGGPYASGTAISTSDPTSEAIRLTADSAETVAVDRIQLKATAEEGAVTETVSISVVVYKPTVADTPVGGVYIDDKGNQWVVLGEENGYKLLMCNTMGSLGEYDIDASGYTELASSDLQVRLESFYQGSAGADIKDVAMAYQTPLADVRSAPGNWDPANETGAEGWSHPGTVIADSTGSNAVFVLSISELNRYSVRHDPGEASWLRSPGETSAFPNSIMYGDGRVLTYPSDGKYVAFHACVWVKV